MSPAYPKPGPKKKRAPAKPTPLVRHDVIGRDKSICQWCGKWVNVASGWYSLQHRRARSMGGTTRPESNWAANLVLVHGTGTTGCHGEIESDPEQAALRGFRITQQQDPCVIPVQCRNPASGLSWHQLDDDGNRPFMTARDAEAVLRAHGIIREGAD